MAGAVCKYFIQGRCQYGDSCRYSHPGVRGGSGGGGYGDSAGRQGGYSSGNDKSKVCHHYLRGTCAFGDRCKFAHVSQQSTGPTYARYGQQHVSQQSTGPIYAQYGRQQQPRVCEHYLNGTCRYGDRCKFEHPSSRWSSGSHTQGHSNTSDHAFSTARNPKENVGFRFSQVEDWTDGPQDADLDLGASSLQGSVLEDTKSTSNAGLMLPTTPQEAAQMIRADMLEWKAAAHMWPLSCYGFNGRCLPDLKDISPEELRWEAYVGKHMGKVQAYIQAERVFVDTQRSIQSRYEDLSVDDAAVFVQTTQSLNPFTSASHFSPSAAFNSLQGGSLPASSGLQLGSHVPPSQSFFCVHGESTSSAGSLGSAAHAMSGHSSASAAAQVVGGGPGTAKASSEQCAQEELAVYTSDRFLLGHIPEHAPPQSIC